MYINLKLSVHFKDKNDKKTAMNGHLIGIDHNTNDGDSIAKGGNITDFGESILTFISNNKQYKLSIPLTEDHYGSVTVEQSFRSWFDKLTKESEDLKDSELLIFIDDEGYLENTTDKTIIKKYCIKFFLDIKHYPFLETMFFIYAPENFSFIKPE